jgi:sulfatase maturation enzyme AslB (radical SAM superfamily)
MTAEEKEIRDSERKVFAEVRKWKRATQKRRESMTPEEYKKYMKELHKEIRARGHKLVSSLR